MLCSLDRSERRRTRAASHSRQEGADIYVSQSIVEQAVERGLFEIDGVLVKGVRIKVERWLCLHGVGQPRTACSPAAPSSLLCTSTLCQAEVASAVKRCKDEEAAVYAVNNSRLSALSASLIRFE